MGKQSEKMKKSKTFCNFPQKNIDFEKFLAHSFDDDFEFCFFFTYKPIASFLH